MEFEGSSTFLSSYAKRESQFHEMSLHQYFQYKFNIDPNPTKQDKRTKVPIYSGAQCEAVFPATAAYARSILMIHSPWRGTFPYAQVDDDTVKSQFKDFIETNPNCPQSVRLAYARAKLS